MQRTVYDDPGHPPSFVSVNPRPLLPLEIPPIPACLPALPSPARLVSPLKDYLITSHIIPAAYPRHPCNAAPVIPLNESTEERKERVKRLTGELVDARLADLKGTPRGCPPSVALFNVFNRFRSARVRKRERKGVAITLLVFHANGFHKEIWEPCLQTLIDHLGDLDDPFYVEEIWTMDAVNHGDSALLNEAHLTDTFDWADQARDILNFVINYLPEDTLQDPPVHLSRLPRKVVERRLQTGFDGRTLVGLGHSFGGCTVTRAALHAPSLFSSLILVDPVITPSFKVVDQGTSWIGNKAELALSRRDRWPSRKEAYQSFLKSPFFRAWNSEVLKAYVQQGIVDDVRNGGVKLKCSGYQEAVVFSDGRVAREVWEMLNQLDGRIELYFIMDGTPAAAVSGGEDGAAYVVWRRKGNCSNVRIVGTGHLIPQEQPNHLALLVAGFLQRKYGSNGHHKL